MTRNLHIVDENVLVVSNDRDGAHRPACVLACIEFLLDCQARKALVLDDNYLILNGYARHCSYSGGPGVGDQFFVWARDNAASLRRLRLEAHDDRAFASFPDDPDLETFDWDDRIYVAAACASADECDIYNAVDSDYRDYAVALARHVEVHELCPEQLRPQREKR